VASGAASWFEPAGEPLQALALGQLAFSDPVEDPLRTFFNARR